MALEIPVVDLDDLRSADPAANARAAGSLRDAFGIYGLVYVRNHRVGREAILSMYESFRAILDRPESEKQTWGGADIWYQRGWTPPNTEQAVLAGGQPDFKECYFAAPHELDARCRSYWPAVYSENVWPADSDLFQERYLAIGRAVHAIGLDLLRGSALALDLPEDAFTSCTSGAAHVSRLLKYLPLSADQVGQKILWGEEHTDFNVLTLLPGGAFYDPAGDYTDNKPAGAGLVLRTRPTAEAPNGVAVSGSPPPGCLVAQVGQQLEVMSGGRFLATPHVIHAPKEPGWTRCSFAHFVHLHGMVPVAPLREFSDADAAYAPPVLAGTYAMKTLVDIGLAPRATLQNLGYRHYDRLAAIRATED